MLKTFCALMLALVSATAVEAGQITIAWDPNVETDIASYVIKYGTQPGVYTNSVEVPSSTTQFTLTNLSEGNRYYITVVAKDTFGLVSDPATEVNGVVPYAAAGLTAPAAARMMFGLGSGGAGWAAVEADATLDFGMHGWARLPWDAYNAANGEMHVALGDVDGDGLDEVVVGLGSGGAGWIAVLDDEQHGYALLKWIRVNWDAYNTGTSGAVYPAVADIDGDGKAEIIAGLGPGGGGWYEMFDDASANFAHMAWGRLPLDSYNTANGELHPALGDFDGDGHMDLALGLGKGGGGQVAIETWNGTAWVHQRWVTVNWGSYNLANGTVWPAAGDLDGDGKAELVLGLGTGGAGWLQILNDATQGFSTRKWIQTDWTAYNSANGETHPAIGNLDTDANPEIIVGLGSFSGQGGWYWIVNDTSTSFAPIGWRRIPWDTYTLMGGPLFPAIGHLR